MDDGPTGGNVNDENLQVNPSISSSEVIRSLLGSSADAEIIDDPTLMIYPDVGSSSVTYKIGWYASVDDGGNSRRVVIDAFNGRTLETESLVASGSYSRSGSVEGKIYTRHHFGGRVTEDFENLKVQAVNILGQKQDTDETSSSGSYSLSWTGATGVYKVGSELEGEYVKSVSDGDNTDLDHWISFSSPNTGTHNWTWSDDDEYRDQLNIFYHTNEIARWYDDSFFNVRFKVKLNANEDIDGNSAWCRGGSTPKIEFSESVVSERQADIIYHEYAHAVNYKLHGRFMGSSGQARALEEAQADYFAQTFLGASRHRIIGTWRDLRNTKMYPADYNSTSSEHQRGLIPAGSAWDLRLDIGASKTDEIIFAAIEMDSPRSNTFQRFFDNVLLADDDLNGNGRWNWDGCDNGGDKSPHAEEIWDAFSVNHGMPSGLLDEDPGCPSPKVQAPTASAASNSDGAYPNPFNSSVQVRYNLVDTGPVDVSVYSSTGQRVRRLVSSNNAERGSYAITWDGRSDRNRDVATGMYIVRVKTPSLIKSFKLSLIR